MKHKPREDKSLKKNTFLDRRYYKGLLIGFLYGTVGVFLAIVFIFMAPWAGLIVVPVFQIFSLFYDYLFDRTGLGFLLALLSTGIIFALLGVVIQFVFRHIHLRRKISLIFVTGLILFLYTGSSIYLGGEGLIGDFYVGIAERKQDSRICDILLNIGQIGPDGVDYCYLRLDKKLNSDSFNCEDVKDAERKGRCYGRKAALLAQEKNFEAGVAVCANLTGVVADYCFLWSVDTCDRIVNKELQASCYITKAGRKGNPDAALAICANLTREIADLCYKGLALGGGGYVDYGSASCPKIIDEKLKQECFGRVGDS